MMASGKTIQKMDKEQQYITKTTKKQYTRDNFSETRNMVEESIQHKSMNWWENGREVKNSREESIQREKGGNQKLIGMRASQRDDRN